MQLWYGTFHMHQYKNQYKTVYTDACEITKPYLYIRTTVCLKMNPWVRNMQKTSKKLKMKTLIQKMCISLVDIVQPTLSHLAKAVQSQEQSYD